MEAGRERGALRKALGLAREPGVGDDIAGVEQAKPIDGDIADSRPVTPSPPRTRAIGPSVSMPARYLASIFSPRFATVAACRATVTRRLNAGGSDAEGGATERGLLIAISAWAENAAGCVAGGGPGPKLLKVRDVRPMSGSIEAVGSSCPLNSW